MRENDHELPLDDIDPDDNFYNDVSCYSSSCKYYFHDGFNAELSQNNSDGIESFTLFHLNVRSFMSNFTFF